MRLSKGVPEDAMLPRSRLLVSRRLAPVAVIFKFISCLSPRYYWLDPGIDGTLVAALLLPRVLRLTVDAVMVE